MPNGNPDLNSEGTQVQRLDRIEQKVVEVGVRADAAAASAVTAATLAREAVSSASEVSRAAAESFRVSANKLSEISVVLFGSSLLPDGGELGRINKKLDAISSTADIVAARTEDRSYASKLQVRGYAIYAILLAIVGAVGFVAAHLKV
ncbi:MAG TPA: hypothetical protein VMW80_14295 [Candidatus Dormibacteraeota bacterium]|nr:hypothetical protein [Candidatus Dormibacteraeota bacterium]